jgi:hypothetical protein
MPSFRCSPRKREERLGVREAAMAPFDDVRARKINDEEETFLDWEGEATLFAEDDEEEEESEEETASADDGEEDEDEEYAPEEDEDVEELDFG